MLFIAKQIMKAKDKNGVAAGQAKYRAYFVKISLYEEYRKETDAILIGEGYEDCIVTE